MSLAFRTLALAAVAIGTAAPDAAAQDAALLVEASGGVAAPLADFRSGDGPGEGTSSGASLSVLLAVPSAGRHTIYAGFSQHRFGCEPAGCGAGGRYVATGFNVGLRFALLRGHHAVPWIQLGAITTRVETEDLEPPNTGVSELGYGGEGGLGFFVQLGPSVGWSSSVLVSTVGSELPGGAKLELRYLTAHTGVSLIF